MFIKYLFTIALLLSGITVFAQEIRLDGIYNGNNLYINNPNSGTLFCVSEIWVNGKKTRDEINSNSFEIDFSQLSIEIGSNVHIRIFHKNGCKPQIINPDAIQEKFDFSFLNTKVNRKGMLCWEIKGNPGYGSFVIEQYRWKKWVKSSELTIKDSVSANTYAAEIYPNTSQNTFRIRFKSENGNEIVSKEIKYTLPGKEIMIVTEKIKDRIAFTATTMYEIVDEAGNLLTSGTEKYIDTSELPKGKYYINYDNKTETFNKK